MALGVMTTGLAHIYRVGLSQRHWPETWVKMSEVLAAWCDQIFKDMHQYLQYSTQIRTRVTVAFANATMLLSEDVNTLSFVCFERQILPG